MKVQIATSPNSGYSFCVPNDPLFDSLRGDAILNTFV